MRTAARVVSLVSLAGTIIPPCLYFTGAISLASMQSWMLGAAATWFLATPFWVGR
jgi:hypothetical protein